MKSMITNRVSDVSNSLGENVRFLSLDMSYIFIYNSRILISKFFDYE